MRWRKYLSEFIFEIVFSPGKLNSVPNALFREYCASFHKKSLYTAQASLYHPGITHLCQR